MAMDFQSAMETFAEAWVAASIKGAPISEVSNQNQALALTRNTKTPPVLTTEVTSRESAERSSTPAPAPSSTPGIISSPQSVKEEPSPGKSIPVHCIVETISVLEESRYHQGGWRRRPLIDTDTYVIIPVGTPFHNLVQVALFRLGYSSESVAAAKGAVLIKNWKALNFDQICDDPLATVGDILSELSTVATLRIQIFRGKPGIFSDIKDKLLRFLLLQSHGLLISSGCPLDEMVLSQICRSTFTSSNYHEITEETRRKFDLWFSTQSSSLPIGRSQFMPSYSTQYSVPTQSTPSLDRSMSESHPVMQTVHNQFPTQKTRMRTSFDPELELPKLQRWFTENQHPSRQQIQQYVKELNNLESRRGRKPLDINNVVYWFKNARAAQKRAEVRNINPNLHMTVNGFTSPSPTNGGFLIGDGFLNSERLSDPRHKNSISRRGPQNSHTSDEYSNVGSDMEDDDLEQSRSPSVPLSLTTNRKSDSRGDSPKTVASPSPAPDILQQTENCKEAVKDEPVNYSSGDHINNNKVTYKDEIDRETEDDCKSHFDDTVTSPSRSISHRLSPDLNSQLTGRSNHESLEQMAITGFPIVPNSMFSHNIMYMSQYIPSLSHSVPSSCPGPLNMSNLTVDERRKRNRTFIDPVTEVPRLEQWFSLNTHPSHNLIIKYTEELNCMAYRQKFPRLEPKNVQFWFKNRRAKCKRLKMSLYDGQPGPYHHHSDRD